MAGFNSVETLVVDEDILNDKDRNGILHHLVAVRAALANVLWKAGIYVGVSLLDEFVLSAAKTGQPDIFGRVLKSLQIAGVQRAGFVLYPLIEFGMEIPSLSRSRSRLKTIAVFRDANFAVTAQANSLDGAYANLKKMAFALGISAPINRLDIEHYARGGNMQWLIYNPLLLVRLSSYTGANYENQFIYTLKIRIASAQVVMLHALSIDAGLSVGKLLSSAAVNNFETLDIGHYLIGEATQLGKALDIRRVPMNVGALELARLSDLAVTLSTKTLNRQKFRLLQEELTPVLRTVEEGFLRHVNLTSNEKVHTRVYRRLLTALDWYRHSFGSKTKESEAIVALAVAFETLLTDHYAPGGAARIARRIGICLKSDPKVREYQASAIAVYHARSEIVHSGDGGHKTEITSAQAAFAKCFIDVASRLNQLNRKMVDPIRELLNDALTLEEIEAKAIASARDSAKSSGEIAEGQRTPSGLTDPKAC
ncbi:hypothetical protein [Microvirga sp. P5_D2]